jgi:hypothetical protein
LRKGLADAWAAQSYIQASAPRKDDQVTGAAHFDDNAPSVKSPSRPYFGTNAQHSNSTSASRANPLAPNAERAGKCSGVKYVT